MNTKFLNTKTNSTIILPEGSILLEIEHDVLDEGMFYVLTASNGDEVCRSQFSFMPGTIKATFNLTNEQFLSYINH
jgi:hypothetical protein